MGKFIGREAELGVLSRAYGSARSEFIPVHGRRRVGKSELVLRFMEDKPGVYYLGQQSADALQVREFLGESARALDGECKWGAMRSARALEAGLEGKVGRYPNTRGATLGRRYFVRRMPASKKGAKGWYSLENLYALDAA